MPINLSLRALRYIVCTADLGNVTRAAETLNVSQSSVSSAIAEFEAQLGTPLFVRQRARGVMPTAAGRKLVADARRLLRHADDFALGARSLTDPLSGEIAIGVFLTLAPLVVPTLLEAFAQSHPGIRVEVIEADQEQLIDGLLSGRIELAIGYDFSLPPPVVGDALVQMPPRLVLSDRHRFARREKVALAEVADEPYVMLDLPLSREYFLGVFRAVGIEPRIERRTRSFELQRGLVARGFGYTLHNAVPRTRSTYDGAGLAVVAIADTVPPVRATRMVLRDQPLRPAAAALSDFLPGAFGPGGPVDLNLVAPPRVGEVQ